MFTKIKIKQLVILFAVLLVIVLIAVPGNGNKKNRTFNSELSNFKVEDASLITIYPKASETTISLEKRGDKWVVTNEEGTFNADDNLVKQMLTTLSALQAKRLAAQGKDNFRTYQLTDSLGTRVSVKGEKKVLTDVYFGKFSYKQPAAGAGNPYMQRQQGTMTTYVRLTDDKDIFAVEGFLGAIFDRKASDLRDMTVLKVNRNELSNISISNPQEQFTLVKKDKQWMVNGIMADSAAMAGYLKEISHLSNRNFISSDAFNVGSPTHELVISEGEQGGTINISAYMVDSTLIGITSTQNEGMYFNAAGSDLMSKLFKPQSYFMGKQ